jgi:hypothetical protein
MSELKKLKGSKLSRVVLRQTGELQTKRTASHRCQTFSFEGGEPCCTILRKAPGRG